MAASTGGGAEAGQARACWGARFRYWEMCNEDFGLTRAAGVDPISFAQLDIRTLDLEATRRLRVRSSDMVASFGVRYAEFDNQQYVWADVTSGSDTTIGSA